MQRADLWLLDAERANIVLAGQTFVESYTWLCRWAATSNRKMYKLRPKLHPSAAKPAKALQHEENVVDEVLLVAIAFSCITFTS